MGESSDDPSLKTSVEQQIILIFFGATSLKVPQVTLAVTALIVVIFLQGTTTVSSVAILFLLARPLTLPGRAHLALNCLLGVAAGQVRKLQKWYTTCRHLKPGERGPTCSLCRRRNFTPVSNACEAAPRSLFCAPNGLNELPEVRFESSFMLIGKSTMAFLTGQSCQSWRIHKFWYTGGDPEQGFRCCFADGLNREV